MQRYFVDKEKENFIFTDEDIFHIQKVMRMNVNDQIEIVNDEICYLCKIISFNPFNIEVIKILDEKRELDIDVTLLYCLPKGEKLDLVIQKATELGVKEIIGVESSRTIVHFDEKKINNKLERFNKIIKEASEQSHRLIVPTFNKIMKYDEAIKLNFDYKFIAYEGEAKNENTFASLLKEVKPNSKVAILVGAEGGFSEDEVKKANMNKYQNVSLGKRILRSETAAIYSLAVIAYERESK